MAITFITDDDYDVQAQSDVLALLDHSDNNSTMRKAEQYAMSEIRLKLSGRYDVKKIFAQVGDEREPYLVMITIDIAIYHLYSQKAPRQIPEYRRIRYEDAMEWLRDVGNGSIATDLPPVPEDEYKGEVRIFSLYKPNNNKY